MPQQDRTALLRLLRLHGFLGCLAHPSILPSSSLRCPVQLLWPGGRTELAALHLFAPTQGIERNHRRALAIKKPSQRLGSLRMEPRRRELLPPCMPCSPYERRLIAAQQISRKVLGAMSRPYRNELIAATELWNASVEPRQRYPASTQTADRAEPRRCRPSVHPRDESMLS